MSSATRDQASKPETSTSVPVLSCSFRTCCVLSKISPAITLQVQTLWNHVLGILPATRAQWRLHQPSADAALLCPKSMLSSQQTSRFRHTQQLHKKEIELNKHREREKFQASESCNRSCPFFNVLHFLFLALTARLSSVGLTSKIPVLNVSINQSTRIHGLHQAI